MTHDLFVFWRHDQFPYVNGGELDQLRDDGTCSVVGMSGYEVTPLAFLPLEAGKKLLGELRSMRGDLAAELAEIEKSFRARAVQRLPDSMKHLIP